MKKKKGCRIYQDVEGCWILGWYDNSDWKSIHKVDKELLIQYARNKGFAFYLDGYSSKQVCL